MLWTGVKAATEIRGIGAGWGVRRGEPRDAAEIAAFIVLSAEHFLPAVFGPGIGQGLRTLGAGARHALQSRAHVDRRIGRPRGRGCFWAIRGRKRRRRTPPRGGASCGAGARDAPTARRPAAAAAHDRDPGPTILREQRRRVSVAREGIRGLLLDGGRGAGCARCRACVRRAGRGDGQRLRCTVLCTKALGFSDSEARPPVPLL